MHSERGASQSSGKKQRLKTQEAISLLASLSVVITVLALAAQPLSESTPPQSSEATPFVEASTVQIRLILADQALTATLDDNPTARDFVSLLPLTLTMNDLFQREKYGHLPRAISTGGKRTYTYDVGDLIYWSPGPDVAIYYREDGEEIPDPGIIRMGKVDSSVEALAVPGSVNVTMEVIHE